MKPHDVRSWALRAALPAALFVLSAGAGWCDASPRTRLIIETDAGGDPDDEQSLVRFLLYADEWDVEGIIANRPRARDGENRNTVRTGLGIVQAFIHAYGECRPMLIQHDPRYPTPESLLARTVSGYEGSDDGVRLIIAALDSDDPRPVWFSNWGTDRGSAPSSLLRALDLVRRERGQEGYARFKNRLRLVSTNVFGEHTKLDPPWKLWVETWQPELDGKRWYHRFSALTATAGGFDVERHVRTGHGPLGALYPTNTTHPQKEGDSLSFIYLIPTGLNDPLEPSSGSWAGRYGPREDFPGLPYYWANQTDALDGTTHRENTLRRWAVALQNDFRARLDWCVKPFAEANHPPRVVLAGESRRNVTAGRWIELDARGTSDPDGDALTYRWFVYPEAGTHRGAVTIEGAETPVARCLAPAVGAPQTVHLVLAVTDGGDPPLTRYARMIATLMP